MRKTEPHVMHIGQIMKDDVANGPGIRLSVFVSGCRIHCKGCFQPQTWAFDYGRPYTPEVQQEILQELAKPQYDGLTILGGEPFEPENQPAVHGLLKEVYERFSDRNVWIYSGCTLEELLDENSAHHTELTEDVLSLCDVIVAGPFEQDKRNIMLPWCGSENQRVIDLNQSRMYGYQQIFEVPMPERS